MSANLQLLEIISKKVDHAFDKQLTVLLQESPNSNIDEIISKLDVKRVEDELSSKHKTTNIWKNVNLHNYDYSDVIQNLNGNSTVMKVRALDQLLLFPIIDTKHNLWGELSQSLRKSSISPNSEIFIRTLKVHHRIIAFATTYCDGYLNLLKATYLLLNSRNCNEIRLSQCLKLVLMAHNESIRFLMHVPHRIIDEIVGAFVNILHCKHIFEMIGKFDSKAQWLETFCYGEYIRNVFFSKLKTKSMEFLKIVIKSFFEHLNDTKSRMHSVYFLLHFLSYNNNIDCFPIKIEGESKEITVQHLLESMIIAMNTGRTELVEVIIILFDKNSHLVTPRLLELLIEPLINVNKNNITHLVHKNLHIFVIVGNLLVSNNFTLIFGNSKKLKSTQHKITINISQKIIDLTMLLLKNNDQIAINKALKCCETIYQSHTISFSITNVIKFTETLRFFLLRSTVEKTQILYLLLLLHESFYHNKKNEYELEILSDFLGFIPILHLKNLIGTLGFSKLGRSFLRENQKFIIRPFLEEIWFKIDYGSDETYRFHFLLFLLVIKFNTGTILALLSDDSEGTVTSTDEKCVNLRDLVEKLDNTADPTEVHLALLVMKVLIVNLDLLLHFEANNGLQQKLEDCCKNKDTVLQCEILDYYQNIGLTHTEMPENDDFLQFLNNPKHLGWNVQMRRTFKSCLSSFNPFHLPILLGRIPKTVVYRKKDLLWPPSDSVYYQLHPQDCHGIFVILKFGLKIGLIQENFSHNDQLSALIKQSRVFLNHQPEEFCHFDWFVGLVYLICEGDIEKSRLFLVNVSKITIVVLIWSTFSEEFDDNFLENFHKHLSVLLEENCASYQVLKELGVSSSLLVHSWLNQCFFNCLPFTEICKFLCFAILYPPEGTLYFFVAIFTHLNDKICALGHEKNIPTLLNMFKLNDFRLENYIEMIEKLMKQNRNVYKL